MTDHFTLTISIQVTHLLPYLTCDCLSQQTHNTKQAY